MLERVFEGSSEVGVSSFHGFIQRLISRGARQKIEIWGKFKIAILKRMQMTISELVEEQRRFVLSNRTHSLEFRTEQLLKLKRLLQANEAKLYRAIYSDFRKSEFETYMTELALVYDEIHRALKNLKKWAAPKRVRTGLANFPGISFILPQPLGQTLIIGAWNYPYQLTLVPLVSALAAGNTAIVKPSEAPAQTSQVLKELINENFEPGYLHVVEGGVAVSQELLKHKYDKIFFTGSTAVGKIVAEAAAQHLTPVTLELGGKSPCFVMKDAPLERTARRIVWGKFLNAGQTCIAPDYILVEQSIYEPFLKEVKKQILKFVGESPKSSEAYSRIINEAHWKRLMKLIDPAKIYCGGGADSSERYIEPTVLKDVRFTDEIMKEEIFGPLLPVIGFSDLQETMVEVRSRPRPLALYVFTRNSEAQNKITQELEFGGGAINDVIMHITNPRLPFGGIGESGMGSYHGEAGFRAFSHYKSLLKKSFWLEPSVKYPPYRHWKRLLIKLMVG